MQTWQSSVFGFPNMFIGIVAFAVIITVGMALLSGATFARWYWLGLQAGVTLGFVFVVWLWSQALYDIHILCPFCMVVWAAMIPLFVWVTVRNVVHGVIPAAGGRWPGSWATRAGSSRRCSTWRDRHHLLRLHPGVRRHLRLLAAPALQQSANRTVVAPDSAETLGLNCTFALNAARLGAGGLAWNQILISRSAESTESEPWTRFCWTFRPQSRPKSPRMVPGAAVVGSVVPARDAEALDDAVAFEDRGDHRAAEHELHQRLVERLAHVLLVVLLQQLPAGVDLLQFGQGVALGFDAARGFRRSGCG